MGQSEQPLKVGVAGLGFGSTEFLPMLEKMPQFKLVAGADLRPQALDAWKSRYGGNVYESVEAMCADPDVEAVWVSTPNQFHGQHALAAVRQGKHICVRKPFALTVEDCQQVLAAADKTGAKILAGGQTQGTSPIIQSTRRLLIDGELGRLTAIAMWAYTGWMLNPRLPQEVDDSQGGGIVWRQMPHQIEAVRWLGGGLLRSVRASAGHWRPERPNGTGYATAYLEFEDGTPVTLTYDAYGYFDTADLIEWGDDPGIDGRVQRRKQLLAGQMNEPAGKEATRFGALIEGREGPQIPWEGRGGGQGGPRANAPGNQGVWVVSCQRGSIRMSADGIYVYDDNGKRNVAVQLAEGAGMAFLESEPLELYNAVRYNRPMLHDGRWGMATAEVQWAILESAKRREEIILKHQVPVPTGF